MIYRVTNKLTARQWLNLSRWAGRCSAKGTVQIHARVGEGGKGELEIVPAEIARFYASHASLGAKCVVFLDPDPEKQRKTWVGTVDDGKTIMPMEIIL